jgi:hypothetical protein
VEDPEAPVELATEADLVQANSAAADASASATVETAQAATQAQEAASGFQTQEALQLTTVTQWASATSFATQVSVWNQASASGGHVSQANVASAFTEASVASVSYQEILQAQTGSGSEQAQWAGQVAEIAQSADAAALADQRDSGNGSTSTDTQLSQLNAAAAEAAAAVTSDLVQVVWQEQVGIDSIQSQQAGQVATVAQAEQAIADAVQAEAMNENLSAGGSFSQIASSQAVASASALSTAAQGVDQTATGEDTVQLQEAWQVLDVVQGGVAHASAEQTQVGNTNVFFAQPDEPHPAGGIVIPTAPTSAGEITTILVSVSVGAPVAPADPVLPEVGAVAGGLTAAPSSQQPAAPKRPGAAPPLTIVQISVSGTGPAPATASLVRHAGGRLAVDTAPDEETTPPPAPAPVASGASAGSVDGAPAPGGPAATATRYLLDAPQLAFPQPMSVVRRPALSGSALERPG